MGTTITINESGGIRVETTCRGCARGAHGAHGAPDGDHGSHGSHGEGSEHEGGSDADVTDCDDGGPNPSLLATQRDLRRVLKTLTEQHAHELARLAAIEAKIDSLFELLHEVCGGGSSDPGVPTYCTFHVGEPVSE